MQMQEVADKKIARRRDARRWNEEETNLLINLVQRLGKGKWKRILEEGESGFQNRSQVGSACYAWCRSPVPLGHPS